MNDVGEGARGEGTDYEALLAAAAEDFTWPQLDESEAAAMCYTSGTTGDPKGVVYSHRSAMLHTYAMLLSDCIALRERDVCLPIVPHVPRQRVGHGLRGADGRCVAGDAVALHGDPASVVSLVASEGVTVSAAVPTVWFGVLQAIKAGQVDPAGLATLERIVCGGSAVPESLMRGFDELGIRIHARLGHDRDLAARVARRWSRPPSRSPRSCATRLTQGIPFPGLDVRVETEDESVAPWDGETMGELQISGPWIADAYYDPDAPDHRGGQDRFATDEQGGRWLRTGDVATIDAEGYIRLVDRTKDLVKSGGEWISTLQIENLLMAHPKVKEAAVIAIPDPKWDERPLACVVKGDPEVTEEELLAHLARAPRQVAGPRRRRVHRRGAQDQRRQVRQEGAAGALPLSSRVSWRFVTAVDLEAASVHLPALEAAGLSGMTEEHGTTTLWFPDRVADLPLDGAWEPVPDVDWNAAWKAGITPVTVGRITIVPPWLPAPDDAELVIVIDPGMAFGTGHHETTTACLAALQEVPLAGRRVLDVGTGTGILAMAAALLGADDVQAVDVDPDAVAIARDNAAAHGGGVAVHEGSVEAAAAGHYDVVVANLDARTLPAMAPALAARLASGGTLIASGIGNDFAETIAAALQDRGLGAEVRPGREWALLVARRASPDGGPDLR